MKSKKKDLGDLASRRAALAIRLRNEKMERVRSQKGKEPRKPRKPRGPRSELTVLQVAMLLGISRDSVYRLMNSGSLVDLHPVSVNKLLVIGHGFSPAPVRYIQMHQQWSAKWGAYQKSLESYRNDKARRDLRNAGSSQ